MPGYGRIGAALLVAAVSSLPSLAAEDSWDQVLGAARTRQVNRALLKQTRFYTCLETITRSTGKSITAKPRRQDVVEVDVGVGDSQEIYSWPGARTFSSKDLPELVGHGLLSTGMFHSFATNLFLFDHGTIRLLGKDRLEDRNVLHFAYTVPHLENEWDINWLGMRGSVEQAGEFWVDASDLTLLRLEVAAKDIPSALELRTLNVSIDYQLLSFAQSPTLLPLNATATIVDERGKIYRDSAAYSHCNMFGTESKMASSSQELSTTFAAYEARRSTIPPGKTMQLVLLTPVSSESARIGEEITARLEAPLKISPGVTAPRNAIVQGHLRRFEAVEDEVDTFSIGLEFDDLSWAGNSYSFLANMLNMQPLWESAARLAVVMR